MIGAKNDAMASGTNIQVTEMSLRDYDDVISLWQKAEGVGLSDADSRPNIQKYLERNPGMSFVARENGTLVGAVLCGHDGRRGYLHHLAVAAAHRRKGIGKALAERCLAELASLGIRKCHLFVFATNSDARSFWKKLAWTERIDIKVMSMDTPRAS